MSAEKIPFSISELQKDFFTRGMKKYMMQALHNSENFQEHFGTQYYDWEIKGDFMYQNPEHAKFMLKTLQENINSDKYFDRIIEEKGAIVSKINSLNKKIKNSDVDIDSFNEWCNIQSEILPYMSLTVIIPDLAYGMLKNLIETSLKSKGIKNDEINDILMSMITITDEPTETTKMSQYLDNVLISVGSPDFDKNVDEFLRHYGYRRSRDLNEKSFWETKEEFLKYIENMKYNGKDMKDISKENENRKQNAIEYIEKNFNDKDKITTIKKLAKLSCEFQKAREDLNHDLIKSYYYARPFIIKIGQKLYKNGLIKDENEIFNLTQEQINNFMGDIHD